MEATRVDIDALAARFLECTPTLDADGKEISIGLYRSLAKGQPVLPDELATDVGLDESRVREKSWPGVFFDRRGRIQGYWGLQIPETRHHFEVAGQNLYTWCAWDTLFLPEILQKTAQVGSSCPVTREAIRLRVHPNGIETIDPTDTVMSFPEVDRMQFGEDIVRNFCHFVHFFHSPEAGSRWLEEHPGHLFVSPQQALELARRKNALQYGGLG